MDTNIKIIRKLKKYHQENLIQLMKYLNEEEKEVLSNQIDHLDFKQLNKLYQELSKKELESSKNIQEITALNKDKLSEKELNYYDEIGENILTNNEYALVTMSGGQGTRLGFDGPKGTFKIEIEPEPEYLFEILADKLKVINEKYKCIVPWYIMTSRENNDDIVKFFEEHQYFKYPKEYIKFFKQDNLPLITPEGKLIIGSQKNIKEAANGNGGIFNSMYKNGIIKDMQKRNIKWIFIGSIDNILLKLADTTLIGLAEDRKVQIATKSILKNSPDEKVGAICKKDGKIKVIEYSEMSEELKNMRNEDGELTYGESHIMCNLFSLKALKKLSKKKLPYHIAFKKSDYLNEEGVIVKTETPNVYKFETFIFDAWTYFKDIAILRGKREEDFAPVKNAEGIDSPETAIKLYNNYYCKKNIIKSEHLN